MQRTCLGPGCSKSFEPGRVDQKYCTPTCRMRAHRARRAVTQLSPSNALYVSTALASGARPLELPDKGLLGKARTVLAVAGAITAVDFLAGLVGLALCFYHLANLTSGFGPWSIIIAAGLGILGGLLVSRTLEYWWAVYTGKV